MTNFRTLLLLASFTIIMISCSKKTSDEPDPTPKDRTESFKNTVWAGEYQYTAGEYTNTQPFSIILAADGTLSWCDVTSKRPGGTWVIKQDTVSITFPNGSTISATAGEESWTNFKGGAAAGVVITQVNKSALADNPALYANTKWTGALGGSILEMTLMPDMKMNYKLGTAAPKMIPFTVEGAGIRFSHAGTLSNAMDYLVFISNSTIVKGLERYVSAFPSNVIYYQYSMVKQ